MTAANDTGTVGLATAQQWPDELCHQVREIHARPGQDEQRATMRQIVNVLVVEATPSYKGKARRGNRPTLA